MSEKDEISTEESGVSESSSNETATNASPDDTSAPNDGVTRGTSLPSITQIAKDPKAAATSAATTIATDTAANVLPGGQKVAEIAEQASETVAKVNKLVSTGRKIGTTIQSIAPGFAAFFGNPITWLVIAAIAILVFVGGAIVAGTHVIGKNENADGCIAPGSSSGGGVMAENSPDKIARSNSIAGWLMSTNFPFLGNKPMTLNQSAAAIGNWNRESGVDPTAVQNKQKMSSTDSNAQIRAHGSGGGMAIGLVQWDAGRRIQLLDYADSKGALWSDLTTQLEFIKKELDGYEGNNLKNSDFIDQSKTVDELVVAFDEKYERSGVKAYPERKAGAQDFLKNYNGGYSGTTGGSCLMSNGGGVNTSDAVSLAISISYPRLDQSYVTPGDINGAKLATPEYKEAKIQAEAVGGKDGMALWASCDRFVATVSKLTMDKDIPWGSTIQQGQYLASSPKWQQYSTKAEAQPGDIWVTKSRGHIVMYVGNVNGQDSIAHASYHHRVAAVGPASYLNANLVDMGGRPYYGYRYIG